MAIPDGFVFLAAAHNHLEAGIWKGLLEDEGLHPLIPGESLGQWAPWGPIVDTEACTLCVPAAEADAAGKVLADWNSNALVDPATRPLRIGVVGAGRIVTTRFIPALNDCADATLQVVASRESSRAHGHGAARVTTRYDDVFEADDVDAVYIGTHNGLHRDQALAALRHGKHVLCEKPLGRNAAECSELLDAAREAGVLLVEAFMYRSHPQVALLQRLIAQGTIGTVRSVEASFSFLLTRKDDVRLVPEWGGGALLDVGCYCVNFSRLILGDAPRRVTAMAGFDAEFGIDTSLSGVLDYGDGRHAVISCGFDSGLRNRALVSGTAGVIELPTAFQTFPDKPTQVLVHRDGATETHAVPAADSFGLMLASFVDACRGLTPAHLAADEGWKNARIMDALVHSAHNDGASGSID